MLTMHCIGHPHWARAPMIDLDGEGAEAAQSAFAPHLASLLAALHLRVEAFVNDPQQTFVDTEESFPTRSRLTGAYYLGDQSFSIDERDGHECYCMSILVCCIGTVTVEVRYELDYLGLDFQCILWPNTDTFEIEEGCNVSVI